MLKFKGRYIKADLREDGVGWYTLSADRDGGYVCVSRDDVNEIKIKFKKRLEEYYLGSHDMYVSVHLLESHTNEWLYKIADAHSIISPWRRFWKYQRGNAVLSLLLLALAYMILFAAPAAVDGAIERRVAEECGHVAD